MSIECWNQSINWFLHGLQFISNMSILVTSHCLLFWKLRTKRKWTVIKSFHFWTWKFPYKILTVEKSNINRRERSVGKQFLFWMCYLQSTMLNVKRIGKFKIRKSGENKRTKIYSENAIGISNHWLEMNRDPQFFDQKKHSQSKLALTYQQTMSSHLFANIQ